MIEQRKFKIPTYRFVELWIKVRDFPTKAVPKAKYMFTGKRISGITL